MKEKQLDKKYIIDQNKSLDENLERASEILKGLLEDLKAMNMKIHENKTPKSDSIN